MGKLQQRSVFRILEYWHKSSLKFAHFLGIATVLSATKSEIIKFKTCGMCIELLHWKQPDSYRKKFDDQNANILSRTIFLKSSIWRVEVTQIDIVLENLKIFSKGNMASYVERRQRRIVYFILDVMLASMSPAISRLSAHRFLVLFYEDDIFPSSFNDL